MSEEDIRRIVRQSVHETLSGLGLLSNEPHEIQADLIYMRKMRKGSEFMSRNIIASFITVAIPTSLYLLWEAIKGVVR